MFPIKTLTTQMDFDSIDSFGNTEGKNSSVYIAHDKQLDHNFIMKVIPKAKIYEEYNSDDQNNLFNESKILYHVKHPNIMEIQHASYDDENICFVMPICINGSLDSLIRSRHLTVREIIKYSLEFLMGLHYIHTNKLIHFDIKPTNILINNNGKAILTDFGLSKYTDAYGFAQPNKTYCPHKPPEALNGYAYFTNLSDIYQSGVTIYRLCNGNDIYNQQLMQFRTLGELEQNIKAGDFPKRNYYLPHIPKQLRTIINKAMNKDPDKRYQTVLEMMNKLSIITNNLDWQYEVLANNEKWSIINNNKTHIDQIVLEHVSDTQFKVTGHKIRISDHTSINHNQWNSNFNSLDQAYEKIKLIINDYN